ncbi:MAG: AAA family ATPase [Candidatus Cloacimonetes bacterium]|nr:AAA family ATPase [Candidatus Cloacimonadota bacterium]
MKIHKLKLQNYKLFKNCEIEFKGDQCVFAGINGAGKSTVLEALVISLSWLVNRIQKPNSNGQLLSSKAVSYGEKKVSIEVVVEHERKLYKWQLHREADPQLASVSENTIELDQLVSVIRNAHDVSFSRNDPMIAYYSVNRATTGRIAPISRSTIDSGWDLYENALRERTGFQSFFDWFRLQDDILNEKRLSQEEWMRRNNKEIQNRIINMAALIDIIVYRKKPSPRMKENIKNSMNNMEEYLWNNPQRYFFMLTDMIHECGDVLRSELNLIEYIHELEYLAVRLADSSDYFDADYRLSKTINNLLSRNHNKMFYHDGNSSDSKIYQLALDLFEFSITIGLWWLSSKGQKDLQQLLNKYRYDSTRRNIVDYGVEFTSDLSSLITQDQDRAMRAKKNDGREVWTIQKAIEAFVPEFTNIRISRRPLPQLMIEKNGVEFSIDQLSDGERCLIALIGDIARRLTIANPSAKNPLMGAGVVLIDELELHLHPQWQRFLIERFNNVFPNCQLIGTTHSPQVISNVKSGCIKVLKDGEVSKAESYYGRTSNRILEDIMDTDARPREIKQLIDRLYHLIAQENLREACALYNNLKSMIGDDPELVKANMLIRRLERNK